MWPLQRKRNACERFLLLRFKNYFDERERFRKPCTDFDFSQKFLWQKVSAADQMKIETAGRTRLYTSASQPSRWTEPNPDLKLCQRAALKKLQHKSIDTFCFIAEQCQNIIGFIETLLTAAQRVLRSRVRPSGQWSRTTALHVVFDSHLRSSLSPSFHIQPRTCSCNFPGCSRTQTDAGTQPRIQRIRRCLQDAGKRKR